MKKSLKRLSHIEAKTYDANWYGLGLKGCVMIQFVLYDMKFSFINTHLASGVDKSDARLKMASSMLKGINAIEPDATSDFNFLLGDFNSRFNRKFSEHINHVKKSPAMVPEFD